MIVVLMGVMGSGKTTVGTALARLMDVPFVDADDYHPEKNRAKMRGGDPLDDDDRQPWLETLNGLMRNWHASASGGVLACSALKKNYREILKTGMPAGLMRFVLLETPQGMLADRLAQRRHEYMNQNLLASQLQTLERPEDALIVMNDHRPPGEIADLILKQAALGKSGQ